MIRTFLFVSAFCVLGLVSTGQEVQKIKGVELEKIIQESRGPVIINFWATWCKPCVEELTYFLEELKDHRKDSLRLLLVSLDYEDLFPVELTKFAKKRNYDKAELFWLDETNADYFCPMVDPKWSGAIPATLFINNTTGRRKFLEGQLSHKDLKNQIAKLISP